LFLAALLGISGVVATLYGGVNLFRVSLEVSTTDGVSAILANFIKCHDLVSAAPTGAWSGAAISKAITHQCLATQAPARLSIGLAGAFMILALICAPCAFRKDKWFGFTMWSTLAIVFMGVAAVVVASQALHVASQFANCKHYDDATIQELGNMGITCVKYADENLNKVSALKWLCKLCTFFGGVAASVASLLLMFMVKSCCCCNPGSCCSSDNNNNACGSANVNGAEHPCFFRRACFRFRSRFCRQSPLSSSADRDDGVMTAPSYYGNTTVHESAPEGVASEDAGLSPSNQQHSYLRVN
jgi:hypothetical protein